MQRRIVIVGGVAMAFAAMPALAQSPKVADPPEARNMQLVG
jgi:hypothetical protein